jgi:hypothetical protein
MAKSISLLDIADAYDVSIGKLRRAAKALGYDTSKGSVFSKSEQAALLKQVKSVERVVKT